MAQLKGGRTPSGPDRHQSMGQTIQSNQATSVPAHASASTRNNLRKPPDHWYITRGLDSRTLMPMPCAMRWAYHSFDRKNTVRRSPCLNGPMRQSQRIHAMPMSMASPCNRPGRLRRGAPFLRQHPRVSHGMSISTMRSWRMLCEAMTFHARPSMRSGLRS